MIQFILRKVYTDLDMQNKSEKVIAIGQMRHEYGLDWGGGSVIRDKWAELDISVGSKNVCT